MTLQILPMWSSCQDWSGAMMRPPSQWRGLVAAQLDPRGSSHSSRSQLGPACPLRSFQYPHAGVLGLCDAHIRVVDWFSLHASPSSLSSSFWFHFLFGAVLSLVAVANVPGTHVPVERAQRWGWACLGGIFPGVAIRHGCILQKPVRRYRAPE